MARPRSFDDILAKLPEARQIGEEHVSPCPLPGHATPEGHLSLKDAGDRALVCCQGGRHSYRDICRWLGFQSLAYDRRGEVSVQGGKSCPPVHTPHSCVQKEWARGLSSNAPGVSLSVLAEAKKIPVDLLKELGLTDFTYSGQPAVRIPYNGEDGVEAAVRFRLALTGENRFRWRKGDHPLPYGLDRLDVARKAGWVLVEEGESDYWTCQLHNIPALGAPGKGIWPASWGEYLKGLDVYVWQEPGAEDFVLRVLNGTPNLRYVRAPDGIKDISEAHTKGLDVPSWLDELKATAELGQELKAKVVSERARQLYDEAKAVVEAPDPLKVIEAAIRGQGYGGDIKPPLIIYVAATSRLLEMRHGAMPVHVILMGLSSGGKSYTLHVIEALMPTEAYYVIDAGSPRVLIYDDAPLEHRALMFGEADSLPAGEDNPAASAIRNLLQDHHLHYSVTIKDKETGQYGVRKVDKPGPTVLITTSTRPLGDQLMTRFFTLEISDSKEQITAALLAQAGLETEGPVCPDASLAAFQSYLQLKAPVRVMVPFADTLGAEMAKMASAPRIHRDFARLMSLIKAVALIRHHRRQVDEHGRIVAEIADYATVRELVNDMYVDSSTGATRDIQKLVEAVFELDSRQADGERITNTRLANHVNIGIKQAERRAKKACRQGWLVNREQRKYHPADYAPGEPMPAAEGLPTLEHMSAVDITDTVDKKADHVFSDERGALDMLTPLTDVVSTLPLVGSDECYSTNATDYEVVIAENVDTGTDWSDYENEPLLGLTSEQVREIWEAEGKPPILIRPGETCFDLAKTLSHDAVSQSHLEAATRWLTNTLRARRGQ